MRMFSVEEKLPRSVMIKRHLAKVKDSGGGIRVHAVFQGRDMESAGSACGYGTVGKGNKNSTNGIRK